MHQSVSSVIPEAKKELNKSGCFPEFVPSVKVKLSLALYGAMDYRRPRPPLVGYNANCSVYNTFLLLSSAERWSLPVSTDRGIHKLGGNSPRAPVYAELLVCVNVSDFSSSLCPEVSSCLS